jgi:hypothetical protein
LSWVTFETAGGGMLAVQSQHVTAIYDEQNIVKLATTAGDVHILKDTTVRNATLRISDAAEPDTRQRNF